MHTNVILFAGRKNTLMNKYPLFVRFDETCLKEKLLPEYILFKNDDYPPPPKKKGLLIFNSFQTQAKNKQTKNICCG